MPKFQFDPSLPYRYVRYGRMSDDQQNARSPDQQFDEINRTLKSLGYCWTHVRDYRDDGVSGKLQRSRKDYMRLLTDIRSGADDIDLILVHTFERLGRHDDMSSVVRDLRDKHGVLVLTADSRFADPNTPQGRVMGAFEALRASEENRVKGIQVMRGKRDAVLLGHWPGGPPPFGYQLKPVFGSEKGRVELLHSILEPDPATRWIIALLFNRAHDTDHGTGRLAEFLNKHPQIPEPHKPFNPQTIGRWLQDSIYYGTLVWPKVTVEVIDDRRVSTPAAEEDQVRVADFCEPLISQALAESVQALMAVRAQKIEEGRRLKKTAGKQIKPPAPGLALKYLLSGLVRCGHCGASMTASGAAPYTTRDGEQHRYVAYVCPRYTGRLCTNGKRVPEEWIRAEIARLLRARLFGVGEFP